jgi:hypothetical protein
MSLDERVNARTRLIARELHETLLQSFERLMLRFQVGIEQRLESGLVSGTFRKTRKRL